MSLSDFVGVNRGTIRETRTTSKHNRREAERGEKKWQAGADDAMRRRDAKNGTKALKQSRRMIREQKAVREYYGEHVSA